MEPPRTTSNTRSRPSPPTLPRALEGVEAEVWSDLYDAATPDVVSTCGLDVTTIDGATAISASRVDVLAFNRVVGLGLDAPATPETLARIVAHYKARNVRRFFVQVSPAATPAALFEALDRSGLRHYNNWVKLYRDVASPPEVSTDLHIERVDAAHATAFAALIAPAFDWPGALRPWLARFVGRPGWRHYMAFDGKVPAATAALYTNGAYGYLGPAATHPDYRRRGAQSALIARRIRDARTLGCETLVTETAEDRAEHPAPSYRNMRRMGFEVAYVRPNYLHESVPSDR